MQHFPQILTLDVTGLPHSWMSWQDVVSLKVKGRIAWEAGQDDFLIRGGFCRATGRDSAVNISSIVALKEKFKRKDRVTLTNTNLFRRDLCLCGYCGRSFREEKLTRDHILPRSRGGKDIWTNVVTACKSCNNIKDNMTPEEADMPLLYVPYEPSHIEELVLKNRNILADQMEFLRAHLPAHSRLIKLHS